MPDAMNTTIATLSDSGVQELLQSAALLRLAYVERDGTPRVIPIGFHWNGRHIVVCTATTAPKVLALTQRPRVAVTIDTEDFPPKALSIRGTAEVEEVDGVPHEFLAASAKAVSRDHFEQFESQSRSIYKRMARISISPEWARYYDFGAGRVPEFLSKLMRN